MSTIRRFGALLLPLLVLSAGGCSKDVKIGAVISETGGVAPYGRQVKKGLELALQEINAEGGFKGGTIELAFRDDAGNPANGAAVVEDLIQNEGIRIIIGAVSSPVTMNIAPICEKHRVLLLSPTSSAPEITDAGEYIFRNYPSDVIEGTAMADFARKQGLRRVVIFALDHEFGKGLERVFSRRFESKSRMILESFAIAEDDPDSYGPMVEEVKELNPEGIYIAAYVDQMVALLQLFHETGIDAVVMASSSVTEQLPALAGEAAEYLVYPLPSFDIESPDPAVSSFVKAYRAKYDEAPDIYAAHGYDALKLIWQSMVNTGFARADEVKRGLHGLESYQGAAGRTAFDERGDVVRYPQLFVVHDGRSVPYEKFEQEGGELLGTGRS